VSTQADRHPVLYGAVGLARSGGIELSGMGSAGTGRRARLVLMSESLTFEGPEGGTLTVTSNRPRNEDDFEPCRGQLGANNAASRWAGCGVQDLRPW
jgi:hypothetical protein